MKTITAFALAVVWGLSLTGCGLRGVEKDLYRTDTVIYIPAEPTAEATESTPETEPAETETIPKPTLSFFSSFSDTATRKPASNQSKGEETEAATAPAMTIATVPGETEHQIYDISDCVVGFLETSMMDQVNIHRREAGLPELQKSDRLSAIASVRAYECCLSWSHTRPDGSDYTTVLQDYGFSAGIAGENLLYTSGNEDGATLVSKWMGAETNRDNLLYDGFTTMGIGVYEANGYVYIACLLAG